MDWEDLRYLLAVVDGGSLSAAGRSLRVSQPTVGRRMAALESRLNARLFERRGRNFVLTPEGETLAESARRMEREALAAQRQLSGRDLTLSGTLRLSATEGIGVSWLTPRLLDFHRRFPDIALELVIDNQAVNLSRREADVAIRVRPQGGAVPWQEALIGRRVGLLQMALYAAPAYLQTHGTPATPEALRDHALVTLDGAMAPTGYSGWLSKVTGSSRIALASNSLLAQQAAVRAGFGIGLIAGVLARDDADLVRVLPDLPLALPELWVLFHADLKRSARVRAIVDFLVAAMEADPDLLQR